MRMPTPLEDQLAAMRDDRLRVLIAGAGVAGVTLAQLLRGNGLHPVLLERSAPDAERGYMLGLMPLVDPVLRQLGVQTAYRDSSVGLHRYRLHGRTGQTLRTYSLNTLLDQFGDYRGISRGELLRALSAPGAPVTFGATVKALAQEPDLVRVSLSEGGRVVEVDFDLLVAAEGLHSATRGLILRPDQVTTYDSGWGGWVSWIDADPALSDLYEETWGAGFFTGVYPVKDRTGFFVGGARSESETEPARFVGRIRDDLREVDKRTERVLAAVAAGGDEDYYWRMTDARAASWAVGRVALLGDAAAGFLPTAGIGAAMAMESAGVLARRLAEADRASVPAALRAYERAQRPRVEAAQTNSRQLARLVFNQSPALAAVRDLATRFVTLKMALGPIRKLLQDQPAA